MQIITRSHLKAFLTGPSIDPEGDLSVEQNAFADAILADNLAQHFVFTDNENGQDPQVGYDDYAVVVREVIPSSDAPNGYYGMTAYRPEWQPTTTVYYCYLGGSTVASATGFVVTTATLVEG